MRHDLEFVREILDRRKKEILDLYGATGTGIGKDSEDNQSYVIVVYLPQKENKPQAPVTLEGIPLRFEVTGPFKLHA
jgi:hypothetical protein